MTKIKFLFSGNFDIENVARHFEKGDEIDVRDSDADRLIVGKCAVAVGGEHVVEIDNDKFLEIEEVPGKKKVKHGR